MNLAKADTHSTICFIGAGNMAGSLIGGLISQHYPADRIVASDINQQQLDSLQQRFDIRIASDNNLAIQQADIIVLAVKPQVLHQVCSGLNTSDSSPLYISIAAGVREVDINRWLGGKKAVIRCMPNTPALVGLGASALYANEQVTVEQKQQAEQILQSTGITVWVETEDKLDAVTAISGSGPAYFFYFIEALQQAAQEIGLDAQTARRLAQQTALGAATMALDADVVKLREQVTSKGGTTEQAIGSFQQDGLADLVLNAVKAAQQRSIELAEQLAEH
ncbi:MAG: pyrroline-5-carboxylate reductase [Chromatiales bacterium]|jgi:pyrroline-5-carboxylate reductase